MIAALRSRPDLWRFVRFLAIGVVNTLFGLAVYALLLELAGLPAQAALILAYVVGVLWNYLTHARFVFGASGYRRLPLYCLAYTAIWLVNAGALAALTGAGWRPLPAQALLVLPMALLSFLAISLVLTGRVPFLPRRGGRDG